MRAIERKGLPREERILASLFRVIFYTRITGDSTCTSVRIAAFGSISRNQPSRLPSTGSPERAKKHEESLVVVLPATGRLRSQEAGCGTEPVATSHRRNHRTLRNSQAGKCQHSNLQLSARDHYYRFKNGAHQAGLQENERGK